MKLKGNHVVVIGGSSGMGLAIAAEALKEGSEVSLIGRSEERLSQAISKLECGDRCRSFSCDVAEEGQVEQLCAKLGSFDHLVITAPGEVVYKPFDTLSKSDARQVMNSKFIGAFLLVKYGKPFIKEGGSIVFTAGINAYVPPGKSSLVSAANGALVAFARALAVELKPIRVNVLSPGWVDTPIWDSIASGDIKQSMFREMAERLPVGRIGRPEDIANAAVLLLTNGYMTGSVLHIEGGRRLL